MVILVSMSSAERSISIPDDLSACQALVEQLVATIGLQTQQLDSQARELESHAQTIVELEQRREAIEKEKEEWQLAYLELLQRAFRRRAERYLQDPNQLVLDFPESPEAAENLAEAVDEAEQTIAEHTRRRRRRPGKPGDEEFPEHIERYEVEVEPSEEQAHCPEHGARKLIGYDTTKTLEIERPKLRVRVTKYPKFVCEGFPECGVSSPERPTGLVEGNRYDTSVAAEVITAKYGFHLPTYRQQDLFAGGGWTPARSTLLNILSASGFVVRPLVEHFKRDVLASGLVGTDDTPVTRILPSEIPKAEAGDADPRGAQSGGGPGRPERSGSDLGLP